MDDLNYSAMTLYHYFITIAKSRKGLLFLSWTVFRGTDCFEQVESRMQVSTANRLPKSNSLWATVAEGSHLKEWRSAGHQQLIFGSFPAVPC